MIKLNTNLLMAACAVIILAVALSIMAMVPGKPSKKFALDNFQLNVIYGHNITKTGVDEKLGLDVYWPPNIEHGKKYPFVMLVHGGSFLTGSKEIFAKACRILADSGFIAVSINYRMGWNYGRGPSGCDADIPDFAKAQYRALQDTHAALRFMIANADLYHINKDWVFIGGASAGAATSLAIHYEDQKFANNWLPNAEKELGGLYNATNDLKVTYKIKGICDMWGGVIDSTLINSKTAVPTIMFHGTADKLAPYDHGHWVNQNCPTYPILFGAACMYRQMAHTKVPAILNSIVNGKHGPVELTAEHLMSNTACFFHNVIKGTAHSGSYWGPMIGCR